MHRLILSKVDFVLVGGFAAVAHGATMVTRDLDVCCRFTEANLARLQNALDDLHPVHRSGNNLPLSLTPEACVGLKNLNLKTDLGIIDCQDEVAGVGDFEEVLKESIEVELPPGKFRVLALDALILAKETTNRDHDRLTVKFLKEIKYSQAGN